MSSTNNGSNVRSFAAAQARARTFEWQMGNDSMIKAGIFPGRCYRFKRTSEWRDGNIAAIITPEGKRLICYLYHTPQNRVTLVFDEDYESECYDRAALTVEGVLDV